MNIWIVMFYGYDDTYPMSVWSTQALAEEEVERLETNKKRYGGIIDHNIPEYTIQPFILEKSSLNS